MSKVVPIGDQQITLNFGVAALSNVLDDFGVTLADLENLKALTMRQAATVLHWGMYHQARVSGQQYEGNWMTAADLLDTDPAPMDAMVRVITAFTDSISAAADDAEKNDQRAKARP